MCAFKENYRELCLLWNILVLLLPFVTFGDVTVYPKGPFVAWHQEMRLWCLSPSASPAARQYMVVNQVQPPYQERVVLRRCDVMSLFGLLESCLWNLTTDYLMDKCDSLTRKKNGFSFPCSTLFPLFINFGCQISIKYVLSILHYIPALSNPETKFHYVCEVSFTVSRFWEDHLVILLELAFRRGFLYYST